MRLTKQYARALLSSIPPKEAVAVFEELYRIKDTLAEFPDYVAFIEIEPTEFKNVRSIFGNDVRSLLLNFLEVLAEDGMLSRLDTILEDFRLALIESNLLFDVKVYSANPLSETQRAQLLNLVEAHWGSDYSIDYRIDSKVLGGIKLEVNGAVIDTTFRSRIDQIIREVQHGAKR